MDFPPAPRAWLRGWLLPWFQPAGGAVAAVGGTLPGAGRFGRRQRECQARPAGAASRAAWIGYLCGLLLPLALPAAEGGAKKAFDIPAGSAAVALKQFSAQSGAQVIFPEDAIEGARTNAVKGAFTPAEAIKRLLSGTYLVAAHDRESGSFAVNRLPAPAKETSPPNG